MDEKEHSKQGSSEERHAETAPEEATDRAGSEVERLREQLAEARERALRVHAELENYRKRARRELEDERRYASVPLLRDLLPVLDNIGRAIEAAEKSQEAGTLLEGFKMVKQQLEGVLQRHECVQVDALGAPFDPTRHDAISVQPSSEHPENTVVAVVQPGFQVHDRVIRPTQVIVSTALDQ